MRSNFFRAAGGLLGTGFLLFGIALLIGVGDSDYLAGASLIVSGIYLLNFALTGRKFLRKPN
jgi:hypothetical protein